MLSFLFAVAFGLWRFIPIGNGILPDRLTFPVVTGRQEGTQQAEVIRQSTAAAVAQEAAKAKATAPIAIGQQVAIANETAPIEVKKNTDIAAAQAAIEQVKACRVNIQQAAGQAYGECVAGGYQIGAICDARRDLVLSKMADCGALPGEESINTAQAESEGTPQ